MSPEEQLADELIARQIDLLRLSAGERRRALAILSRMEEELIGALQSANLTDAGRAAKAALLRQSQEIIGRYYDQASEQMGETLVGLAPHEAAVTAGLLAGAVQSVITPSLPPARYFDLLLKDTLIQGAPSAAWWSRQAGDVAFRFQAEVSQGLAAAETNAAIIKRVQAVMDVSRRNAAALVQTSVQTVANAARLETFRENGDLLRGVRQLSTLDGKTSLICIGYSGAEWTLDGKPIPPTKLAFNNGPPRHFNCRSVLVPILKPYGLNVPESTRASMDGQVAAGTTFADFLGRKSRGFADDLLGPGRADLWRNGRLTLSQLLDQAGRPLSLEELRAKYGG